MLKKSTLVALSMALAVAVPLSLAQGSDMDSGDSSPQARPKIKKRMKAKRNRGKQKYNIRVLNRLSNLTDDQSSKLESIQSTLKTDMEPIVTKMRTLKEELQGKRKEAWDKAFALLTDEQKTELESIMQSRQKRLREGGKRRKHLKGAKRHKRKKLKQENNLESVSNSLSSEAENPPGQ